MRRPPRQNAFSLIELMIAISIIGLLIAASVVSYNTARRTTRDSKRVSDLLMLGSAFETATSTTDASLLLFTATSRVFCNKGAVLDNQYAWLSKYLPGKVNNSLPTDPFYVAGDDAFKSDSIDSVLSPYNYRLYVNTRNSVYASPRRTLSTSPVVTYKLKYMLTAQLEGPPSQDSEIETVRDVCTKNGGTTCDTQFNENLVIVPGSYCGNDCPIKTTDPVLPDTVAYCAPETQ